MGFYSIMRYQMGSDFGWVTASGHGMGDAKELQRCNVISKSHLYRGLRTHPSLR